MGTNRNEMILRAPIALSDQYVAYNSNVGAAVLSAALPVYCPAVTLQSTTDCRVELDGETNTAYATGASGLSTLIKAGIAVVMPLEIGGAVGKKISVISNTGAGGNLNITPLSN